MEACALEVRGLVPAGRRDHVLDVLTLAFAADPAVRWMYPDATQYLDHFPAFVQAFAGAAFRLGTADCREDGAGAALWLPPGAAPDEEALVALIGRSVLPSQRPEVMAVFEAMDGCHPAEPHWYLPLIGVVPSRQGHGVGTTLLAAALRECDREGRPAYLEATSPRSIPLYRRHGFEVVNRIQIGTSPPIFPMLRPAR